MGKDERLNPFSRANGHSGPPRQMPILELGDGNAISAQIHIVPQHEEDGTVGFYLTCLAGHYSDIAGFQARPIILGKLGDITRADLLAKINPPEETEPAA